VSLFLNIFNVIYQKMRPFLRKNILNNAAALFSIFKSTNEAKKQFSRFEQNDF
jgi:hypothetical protein